MDSPSVESKFDAILVKHG